jgi:hypothetical protein
VRLFVSGATNLRFQHGPVVDPNRPALPISVIAEAAPAPLLGLFHQPAFYRVAMNVAQLLNALVLAPDIVVVKPAQPNVHWLRLVAVVGRADGQDSAGEPELQCLHDDRRIAFFRFADQKVEVFGHDHVA